MKRTKASIIAVVLTFAMLLNIFGYLGPLYAEVSSPDKLEQNERLISVTDNSYGFSDIAAHWAKEGILKLSYMEILQGFPDGRMKPDKTLTREEFIVMLVRAVDLPLTEVYQQTYGDVEADRWSSKYIAAAKNRGLLGIYSQNMLNPAQIITREEMAVIAASLVKDMARPVQNIGFTDLNPSYQYLDSIHIVTALQIIKGMPDGTFRPYKGSTRAQAAVVIQRILDLKTQNDAYDNNELLAFAENYEKSWIANPSQGTLSSTEILASSIGKENRQNVQRAVMINNLELQRINLNRNVSDFIAFINNKSLHLAEVTVSYKLTNTTLLGSLKEYKVTRKLFMKKNDSKWTVYDSAAVYSILNEVVVHEGKKINLTWHPLYSSTPDMSGTAKLSGVNVISPTWFTLNSRYGDFKNIGSLEYTNWAHQNGYEVWALVSNDFNRELTSQMMNNAAARKNAVDNLIKYAKAYNLDGLNMDFEYMYTRDKDLYTQFVRELYQQTKPLGITLSVDVTVIANNSDWSSCYDRKALAQVSDYIALMAYDQHWSGSPVSGSVAQLKWVEDNMKKVLLEVPKDKLLLGMPFYTRVWKEVYDANGKLSVTSSAVSMTAAERLAAENNAVKTWDAVSGQYLATYKKDGATYKIWLEDETSIRLRVELANRYQLAGVASWRMGFEKSGIWEVINTTLK